MLSRLELGASRRTRADNTLWHKVMRLTSSDLSTTEGEESAAYKCQARDQSPVTALQREDVSLAKLQPGTAGRYFALLLTTAETTRTYVSRMSLIMSSILVSCLRSRGRTKPMYNACAPCAHGPTLMHGATEGLARVRRESLVMQRAREREGLTCVSGCWSHIMSMVLTKQYPVM